MANTFELIASSTVGSGGAASIDFTSIPSTYTDLVVKCSIRDTTGGVGAYLYLRFNNDSGSNYSSKTIEGNGSAANSYSNTSQTKMLFWNTNGGGATSNTFGNAELYVPNYLSSNQKSVSMDTVAETNATVQYMDLVAGIWTGTSAINQLTLLPDAGFAQYSTAYLYGVKNA
jgi:hypothetical protein